MPDKFAFRHDAPETKWECDGCGRVHPGSPKDAELCGCKTHQGWMGVGGPAWHDYHDKGIHPMTSLTGKVRELYNKKMVN